MGRKAASRVSSEKEAFKLRHTGQKGASYIKKQGQPIQGRTNAKSLRQEKGWCYLERTEVQWD